MLINVLNQNFDKQKHIFKHIGKEKQKKMQGNIPNQVFQARKMCKVVCHEQKSNKKPGQEMLVNILKQKL